MSAPEQTQAAAAAPQVQESTDGLSGMLDRYDKAARSFSEQETRQARGYFEEFLRTAVKPGQVISKDVEMTIKLWVAEIDKKLSAQLNEVMHDEKFQNLEGTWRGLHYLVMNSDTGEDLKLKVRNVSK